MRDDLPGVYNAAGDGVLVLSEVASLLGKPLAPILPPWGTGLALRRAAAARAAASRPRCSTSCASGAASTTASSRRRERRSATRRARRCRRSPSTCGSRRSSGDGAAPYRYEREVEEFLRYSPSVRREQRRASKLAGLVAGAATPSYHRFGTCVLGPSSSLRRSSSCSSLRQAGSTRTTPPVRTRSPRGSRSAGCDVGGMTRGGRASQAARARARAARPAGRRALPRQALHAHARSRRASASTSTARSHQAIERSREGNIFARTCAQPAGQARSTRTSSSTSPTTAGRSAGSSSASAGTIDRPARDANARPRRRATSTRRRSATGLARARDSKLRKQLRRSLLSVEGSRQVKVQTKVVEPKVTTKELAKKYPADRDRLARLVQALALQEPQAREDLRDRRRPGRPRDARRASTTSRTRRSNPAWTCRTPTGRAGTAARSSPAARREPAQGALARHLRRRRHPRHRRRRARSAPPPRTAASGCASRT